VFRSLDIEEKRQEVEERHQARGPSGNVGDCLGRNRVDENGQRAPERDRRAFIRYRAGEDAINQKSGTKVQQEIEQMVADGVSSIWPTKACQPSRWEFWRIEMESS